MHVIKRKLTLLLLPVFANQPSFLLSFAYRIYNIIYNDRFVHNEYNCVSCTYMHSTCIGQANCSQSLQNLVAISNIYCQALLTLKQVV